MEKIPKNTPEKQEEKPSIKEGVDFVFEQNPELATIGSREEYSEYLQSIFPETKFGSIIFHNTSETFENFDRQFISKGNVSFGEGFYFTDKIDNHKGFRGSDKTISAVVNLQRIFIDSNEDKKQRELPKNNPYVNSHDRLIDVQEQHNIFLEENFDGVIATYNNKNEIVVFHPENIHILGSQKDIDGFKKFIESKQ